MPARDAQPAPPLLEVRDLRKAFVSKGLAGRSSRIVAAERICFRIDRGEAVALVGESGSGKSTVARMLLRLESPDGGEIRLDGVDALAREPRRASLAYRARVQMVFQDPFSSLNPVHTVAHHLMRPLLRHGRGLNPVRRVGDQLEPPAARHRPATAAAARGRAVELLRVVGLEPPEDFIDRHPYELSGGQRQRVAIARALAVDPDLLVADEPTSMLDVSIRMSILNLLGQLKRDRRLAILLITHDLASARYLADRVLVLFRGRVVEDGPGGALVENPAHPYTRALLASIADADEGAAAAPAPGRAAAVVDEGPAGAGCPFAARCPDRHDLCERVDPGPREVDGRRVRCHLYSEAPAGGRP